VAASVAGGRPHPTDPGRGRGAGDRLVRRKTLAASTRRFGRSPQGDAKAADGHETAPEAVNA
jgi:hypothetical protein